ncbi:N-acetylmuramoyl-L-alanine amidase [Bacillus mycoides]|uniref:N-acetylmuramoyl-L-alanine amidase n=1 Tax=Bacillus mycoides TaxID=1405 RepID=UPI00119E1D64|nr:N-acetylmuramoyl-L-alanine amidase [Bacillus mycoides]
MAYQLFTSHAGHTQGGGARGCGYEESAVARQFNTLLIQAFKSAGQSVVDTTDNVGKTQNQNLNNLVRNCNSHPKEERLDISLHLNSGGGTGVEVLYYDQRELAAKVSSAIANATGLRDRGPKERKELAVLKGTNAPAILIELAFIDNTNDMKILMSKMQQVVNAIVQAVTGKTVSQPQPSAPQSASYRINIGDFDSIEWTAAALTKVKEILPGYGVWTQCLEGGYHRILVGDFNSKQWADDTIAKLKSLGYGMWIQNL